MSCLGELTGRIVIVSGEKRAGVASDGQLWVSKALRTINAVKQDTKHIEILNGTYEDDDTLSKVIEAAEKLGNVTGSASTRARGARLLIEALCLYDICSVDGEERDTEPIGVCRYLGI
jgi:DNA polymerase phi